jgi:hypothetical protein
MAEALLLIGVALNVVFWILILVNLARNRHSMELRQVLKWAILLALLPGLGLLGNYLERTERYELFFVVALIGLVLLGLVLLARDRHSMETSQVVKWAILMVIVPAFGVLGYLFRRVENSARDSPVIGHAVLRKPTPRDR